MPEQAQDQGPSREPARGPRRPHRPRRPPAPAKVDPDAPPPGTRPAALLDLQRRAGNRAVAAAVEQIAQQALQRVPIKVDKPKETLYNQDGAGGKAAAKAYGGPKSYDMTRNGDSGVTVTVRIRFMSQTRNTTPPTKKGDPELGAYLEKEPKEIPADDPDKRRDWCNTIVKEQVKPWNGRLTLVGEETNVFAKNTPKRLPVTFDSVAVFGADEKHDKTIIVHPSSVPASSKGGNPIDAGNYYLNKGTDYGGADDNVIAAHEYGHLLGIDDEYSQSNEMLNALLHRAAPKGAASAMGAVDKKTIEQMVLSSLKQPLIDRLTATVPQVAEAFRAKRAAVKAKMAGAARTGVVDAAVRTELEKQLTAASDPKLGPSVPRVVAFQTTKNFSNLTLSGEGVEAGFNPAGIGTQIVSLYTRALGNAQFSTIDLAGVGKTTIRVHDSVPAMTATGGAQQGNAATAAADTMGTAGGPAGFFGFPVIVPSAGLIGQLAGLPATWGTAGSAVETGITPTLFATKMAALVKSATAAAAVPPPAGTAPVPKLAKSAALYKQAHAVVSAMTKETCRQLSAELINAVVQPVLATSVKDLGSLVQNEVGKVTGATPTTVAGLGPPNPAMVALVAHMKAQLDADKKAAAGGGISPLGAGKAAPDQHVTYSVQSMMGSNDDRGLRSDQFTPMVNQFNDKLKSIWEKKFTPEVK